MADVLEIEVDGEPVDEAPRSGYARSSWGFPAAIAVAGALAIAVLVVMVLPALTRGSGDTRPTTSIPKSDTNRTTIATPNDPDQRVVAAEAALAAWGEFAVSGDVEALEGSFDRQGPQFQDLVEQSGRIRAAPSGPPAYEVTLAASTVESISTNEAVVTGTVEWARPGELDQAYRWEIVLRRTPSTGWLLWTTRSSS